MPDLVLHGLTKTYPNGVQALKGVSLAIQPGMFGLLGPNGAGKSTLMRTLATLQDVDGGTARWGEVDILRDHDAVRRQLGYLPQDFGVYPKVTAYELLDHIAQLKGVRDRGARAAQLKRLLTQTNLLAHRNKALGGFSGGMRQRFGIAQALLGDPKLIIVDEPTAGLDPEERVRFHNLLAGIGQDVVVILSTHIVQDVADLCTQMAIINKGEVLATGSPLDFVARITGQVWQKFAGADEIAHLKATHRVLSTRLFAGRTQVRVLAGARPDASFEPTEAVLEDVYFATIAGYLDQGGMLREAVADSSGGAGGGATGQGAALPMMA